MVSSSTGAGYILLHAASGGPLSCYTWGGQVEDNTKYSTSDIVTTAAIRTRLADTLEYKGDDGNLGGVGSEQRGTIKCRVLLPDATLPGGACFVEITDGASHNDRILAFRCDTGYDEPRIYTSAGGVAANTNKASAGIADGDIHELKARFDTDGVGQIVDGALDPSPETSATDMPDDLDRITVGQYYGSATVQPNGLIADLEIYKEVV
jgi:hypothetical protein